MNNTNWRVSALHRSSSNTGNSRRPPLRKPLNCKPCRQSKAKCDRQAPCGNCRRRQCVSSCSYENESTILRQSDRESSEIHQVATSKDVVTSEAHSEDSKSLLLQVGPDEPARCSGRDATASSATTCNLSTIYPTDSSESPGFDGVALDGIRSNASVAVDSHMRQFRWDAPLHTSISNGLFKPHPMQSNIGFPFESNTDLDTLIAILPPAQHCEYLVSRYFALFSPLFHILHEPSFYAGYGLFARSPQSVSLSWLALLFVILALAVTCLDDDDSVLHDIGRGPNGIQKIKDLSVRFRGAAMECLAADDFLANHSISTLQATILLIYAINHSQGVGQSWTILGIALNMSIALGCHIDGETMNLSILDTQQRRRCWAGITMLHAIQASVFGLSDSMRMPDDQVKLPEDVNDIDIKTDHIDAPSSQPTEMSYMLYKFRLYRLSSEVCKHIVGLSPASAHSWEIFYVEAKICEEEVKWNERYLRDGGPDKLPDRDRAHWSILHCYANQMYLLINRPFLSTPAEDETSIPRTFSRCLSAGLSLLDAHRLFCTSSAFSQYRWFTNGLCSFFALHGAVTVAVCMMKCPNFDGIERSRLAFEEAVQRFSERREESDICARALPVLNFLRSMLVLPAGNSKEVARSLKEPEPHHRDVSLNVDNIESDLGFEEAFHSWTHAGNWTGPNAIQWDIMEAAVADS